MPVIQNLVYDGANNCYGIAKIVLKVDISYSLHFVTISKPYATEKFSLCKLASSAFFYYRRRFFI